MSTVTGAVVVGVDDTAEGRAAVRLAFAEAAVRRTGVVLVRAGAEPADDVITRVVSDLVDLPVVPDVRRVVAEGPPGPALVAAGEGAELLVVGRRGRTGASGVLLGSVSQHCARHATCPIALVAHAVTAAGPDVRPPAVVVGVDGSPGSQAALGWGVEEAIRWQRPLRAVTIWHPDAIVRPTRTVVLVDGRVRTRAAAVLSEAVSVAVSTATEPVDVEELVLDGSPYTTLLACTSPHDLLVLGTRAHSRRGAGLVPGSVVQHALGRAPCPVVVVRGPRPAMSERRGGALRL